MQQQQQQQEKESGKPKKKRESKARTTRQEMLKAPVVRRPRWTQEANDELKDLFQNGESLTSIAHKTKRSVSAVATRLKAQGFSLHKDQIPPYSERPWVQNMLFTLKCEHQKHYVAHTTDLARYVGEIFLGAAFPDAGVTLPQWLKLHAPVEVEHFCAGTLDDENQYALNAMAKYGWQNVRSTRFHQVDMKEPPKQLQAWVERQEHQEQQQQQKDTEDRQTFSEKSHPVAPGTL
jgi:hypothetical protein